MKLKITVMIIVIAIIAINLYMIVCDDNNLNDKPLAKEKRELNKKILSHNGKDNILETKNSSQHKVDQFESRFTDKKPEGVTQRNWNVLKKHLKSSWLDIKDINYYCVVLNQFQEPVEGAEVTFKLSKMPEDVSTILESTKMNPKENKIVKIISNEKGIVHLTGVRGDSFGVKNIIKTGYSFIPPSGAWYNFELGRKNPQSSLDKPVKVYLIENDASEPLYKRSFYKDLKYNETWEIDVLRRNKRNPQPEHINLLLSCRQLKKHYDTRDWELTLDPPPGTEIALTTKSSFLAEGLSSSKIVVKNEDMKYKGHFYIFYHDLKDDFYSKLKIEVSGGRKTSRVRIYSFSNPIKGSRVLSYLKEKELKKWPGVIYPDKK